MSAKNCQNLPNSAKICIYKKKVVPLQCQIKNHIAMTHFTFLLFKNGRCIYQSSSAACAYKRASSLEYTKNDLCYLQVGKCFGMYSHEVVDEFPITDLIGFAANWTSKRFYQSLFK